MQIHYFQHVPFEDPAYILTWARKKGHSVSGTLLFKGGDPKNALGSNLLIVMGGPMNIYEHDKYPWLAAEKQAIRQAIDHGTFVLGICLGAQLIADVLGAAVTKNGRKEIGWFPLVQTNQARTQKPFDVLPQTFCALHWHGDTFAIPDGAIPQGSSEACANQGFIYQSSVIGLQYHIEATPHSVAALINNCGDECIASDFVHEPQRINRDTPAYSATANSLIAAMLDRWIA